MNERPQTDDYLKAGPRAVGAGLMRRWRGMRAGVPAILFLLGAALLVLLVWTGIGLFLSKVLRHDPIGRLDHEVAQWFLDRRTAALNDVTHILSYLAETITVVIAGVLVFAAARLAWKRWRESMLVLVGLSGELLIFLGLTITVDRHRPPVPKLDIAPPTSSFPSGHTAAAVVLYGILAMVSSRHFRSAILVGAARVMAVAAPLLVATARMYRGMHFLTDVIAGALLGLVWLAIAIRGVRLGVLHRDLRAQEVSPP
jgi:membrane-associated phospholipid phosphatase